MVSGRTLHEEKHTSAVANMTLLKFFKSFFRPYVIMIVLATLLAVGVTATDLILPQLLKIAMDRYLTQSARKVCFDRHPEAGRALYKEFGDMMEPAASVGCFYISSKNIKIIGESGIARIEKEGFLVPEKYYAARNDAVTQRLVAKHPVLFDRAGDGIYIAYSDFSRLASRELLQLRSDDVRGIMKLAAAFLGVVACGFFLNFFQIYLVEYTSQNIMHDLRSTVFAHIQSRSMAFFYNTPVGRLVTRATNDVQNLHEMFSALFANVFKDIFLVAGIMIILFSINWQLSLVSFAVLPFLVTAAALFSVTSRSAFREVRIKIAAINAAIQENITGISVVKSFCREHFNDIKFRQLNQENYRANMRQTTVFAVFSPLVDVSRYVAIALIIWYGGAKSLRGAISIGTIVVFLYYMRMFFRPIQDIAEKYNILQSALASLERIYLLLDDKSRIEDPAVTTDSGPVTGTIEFRNVCFGYNAREPVLKNFTCAIAPGETVAIVGLTGAGKTTIINLLERFYDVDSGSILVDGRDIRSLKKSYLRSQMGLVMQDVFMFAGTIRSNLLVDGSDSDAAIMRALKVVNAEAFIQKLSGGIDHEVTEGGKTFSAGQRQLLALARGILSDPNILILDEATSNIDSVTERLIQDALDRVLKDRTAVVIAHRLSTIKKADRIILLHKGAIREQGTHDELIRQRGLYYNLSRLQYMEQ